MGPGHGCCDRALHSFSMSLNVGIVRSQSLCVRPLKTPCFVITLVCLSAFVHESLNICMPPLLMVRRVCTDVYGWIIHTWSRLLVFRIFLSGLIRYPDDVKNSSSR